MVKKFLTDFRIYLVLFLLVLIYSLKQEQIHQYSLNDKQRIIDSLEVEMFSTNILIGKYEVALDYLNTIEPKTFKRVSDFLSNETE